MINKLHLDYLSFNLDDNPHFHAILNTWIVIGHEWGDRSAFLSHVDNNAVCVITANDDFYDQTKKCEYFVRDDI